MNNKNIILKQRFVVKKVCILSLRNIGDAVIQSNYINRISKLEPEIYWIIWTKPESKFFFESISNSEIYTSPSFFIKEFSIKNILKIIKVLLIIKSNSPDMSIDFFGDWRELLICKLINAKIHVAPGWTKNHVFRKLIRAAPIRTPYTYNVNIEMVNVYEVYENFMTFILKKINYEKYGNNKFTHNQTNVNLVVHNNTKSSNQRIIGVHPFASQQCRIWPMGLWIDLIIKLKSLGFKVKIFGSPSERTTLIKIFSNIVKENDMVTIPLSDIKEEIITLDILIGLDSFSIHLANLYNIKNIMINGGNNPDLFRTPLTYVIYKSGNCKWFPCYNKPKCLNTSNMYSCIKSITVQDVLNKVICEI